MPQQQAFINQPFWLKFKNNSGEEVPGHGIVELTRFDKDEDAFLARQSAHEPGSFGAQFFHYINGPQPVRAGDFGICTRGPAFALFDTIPAGEREQCGPRNGSWGLTENVGGFLYWGGDNTVASLALVEWRPLLSLTVQLTEAIAEGNTGDANPAYFRLNATRNVHTNITISVTEGLGTTEDLPSGSFCHCSYDAGLQGFLIDAVECE